MARAKRAETRDQRALRLFTKNYPDKVFAIIKKAAKRLHVRHTRKLQADVVDDLIALYRAFPNRPIRTIQERRLIERLTALHSGIIW